MKKALLKYGISALIAVGWAVPELSAELTCRYWLDAETDISKAMTAQFDTNSFLLSIDTAPLSYGLHTVTVMVGLSEQWSPALCRLFYKPEPVAENVSRKLLLNVDGARVMDKALQNGSDIVSLDAAMFPSGLHTLDCLVLTSAGETVTTGQKLFYKPEPVAENVSRKLQVNIDGVQIIDKPLQSGGDIITIDTAKLPSGLHCLDCLVLSSTGEAVTSGQKLFYKPEPELTRADWAMTFLVNGQRIWNGELPDGEDVVMLDVSALQTGVSQLVCLFTSDNGESFVAGKKNFYKPCDIPNSIKGYLSAAGSEYVGAKVSRLGYTIEFENGGEADAAPVNVAELKSVLAPDIFELSSFAVREVRIGGKSLSFDGRKTFHERLDMRPERNAVADIVCEFDEATGYVAWRISSLDPATMNVTEDKAYAILPANIDGWGMAEIVYDIQLRENLADGLIVDNSVNIAFDGTETAAPAWRNILDLSLPESRIDVMEETAGGYRFEISGNDTGSGIWKYELYRKNEADGTWMPVMTDIYDVKFEYLAEKSPDTPQFATVAIDRAGNVEISPLMNSGIMGVPCEPGRDENTYYMPNGMRTPEGYNGIQVGKDRKLLKSK